MAKAAAENDLPPERPKRADEQPSRDAQLRSDDLTEGLDPRYVDFLNQLCAADAERLQHTFLNIPPGSPEKPGKTLLEKRRELLKELAGLPAIADVVKKAYKTLKGREIIERLTAAASHIVLTVDSEPSDLQQRQAEYLESLLKAVQHLRFLIWPKEASGHEHHNVPEGEDNYDAPQDEMDDAAVRAVLGRIQGRWIRMSRAIEMRPPPVEAYSGRVGVYGLRRLLHTVESSLQQNAKALLHQKKNTTEHGEAKQIRTRRIVLALYDALEPYAQDFQARRTGPLKRNALVTAFVQAFTGTWSDHDVALRRVAEIRQRGRKSISAKSRPPGNRPRKD